MHEGKDREAIPCYLQAIALGPETDLLWLNLGISYSRAGNGIEAQKAFRRGLALSEKEILRNPRNGRARSELAYLSARLGDVHRAQSEAAQALQLSLNDKDTRMMAAETYEILGRRESTLAVLGGSPGDMLPSILAQLSLYPDVTELRKDPRFLQLKASYHVQ